MTRLERIPCTQAPESAALSVNALFRCPSSPQKLRTRARLAWELYDFAANQLGY